MNTLQVALRLARDGHVAEAEAVCERLCTSEPDRRPALALLGDLRLAAGRTEAAIAALEELAVMAPRDAANLRRLGGALLTLGRREAAVAILMRAVDLEPDNARGHNNLGQAQLQSRQLTQALACFTRALELAPDYAIAHFNRALTLEALERHADALREYDACVALQPAYQAGWAQRGALQWRLGRYADALASLDRAVALRADDAISLTLRAGALLGLERAAEALAAADAALAQDPKSITALQYRAAALAQRQRLDEAARCLQQAIELAPDDAEIWCNLAVVHLRGGDAGTAQACYTQALEREPASLAARAGLLAASVPPVPQTLDAAIAGREAFEASLAGLQSWLSGRQLKDSDVWTLAQQPFFYLSYQECSNRSLLEQYRVGAAQALATRFARPTPRPSRGQDQRMRLGIVSAHVFEHSVFRALTQGWLTQLDRERFEITVFHLGLLEDTATALARRCAHRFESGPRSVPDWAQAIGEAGLDALLYPEIGMDRGTLALASLRLAPRQFAAWGHPETSGIPSIDVYLSAEAFEPAGAEAHYSERLVRLPHLGVYVEPPVAAMPPILDLNALGLRCDAPWFICPGTPYKYAPEHDAVWTRIAQRVPGSTLVFFEYERAALSERLRCRLEAAFAAAGLDPQRQLRWLAWQPRANFRELLRQATGYLDTLGFSGFNTMLLGLDSGVPCVTMEGRFQRGRLGSGILRHVGLTELVASDPAAYVDVAVRLGTNAGYRSEVAARVRDSAPRAYADLEAVRALERVLLD